MYTFTIRDDARFSDNSTVTASDFKYAIERAANPDTESTVAELYLADIIGVSEIIDGAATTASGIEVVDDKTLRFTILITTLASFSCKIVGPVTVSAIIPP